MSIALEYGKIKKKYMKISERIRYVGVSDYGNFLFEGLWPVPYGVSYNSYLIIDEKIALIDTVEEGHEQEYMQKIREELGDRHVDYLIVNHMEPDHSSLMKLITETYPGIRIVTSAKSVPMIKGYHGLDESMIHVVKEGEKLSLGSCELTFYMAPMVHWPEVMVTWFEEEKTLFSADAFGTFGALKTGLKDLTTVEGAEISFTDEMTRYYANIVGKFGGPVQTALKKLSGLPTARICSTHGPVWENMVSQVVGLYDRLSRYEAEPGVCIAYGSMYGNTEKAALALADELRRLDVPVALHNLNVENVSETLRDVFRYDTIAVGSPTYNGGIFPPVEAFMRSVSSRMVKNRRFFAFGSFTWAGTSVRQLNELASAQGFELISEGSSFAQAYSPEKCDMKAIAELIKG